MSSATAVRPGAGACVAPADYDQFAREHTSTIRAVARRMLGSDVQPADIDEVVQDITEKLIINDVIGQYRPGTISGHTGRQVTFKAFLSRKAELYCRWKRDTLNTRKGREPLIADTEVRENVSWAEMFGGQQIDDYRFLDDDEVYQRLRAHLTGVLPEGDESLAEMMDKLAAVVDRGGFVNVTSARAASGGGTYEQARTNLADLRAALAQAVKGAGVEPRFQVGPMMLTLTQVQQAIDLLCEAPGNRVLPVFAAAGHPLAKAGKTWYLDFAREEQARYPELKGRKGGHYQGGHGSPVKAAMVHRLRRILNDADPAGHENNPVPGPSAPRPADELEAAARAMGASDEQLAQMLAVLRGQA